jgi:hypothetical protein
MNGEYAYIGKILFSADEQSNEHIELPSVTDRDAEKVWDYLRLLFNEEVGRRTLKIYAFSHWS